MGRRSGRGGHDAIHRVQSWAWSGQTRSTREGGAAAEGGLWTSTSRRRSARALSLRMTAAVHRPARRVWCGQTVNASKEGKKKEETLPPAERTAEASGQRQKRAATHVLLLLRVCLDGPNPDRNQDTIAGPHTTAHNGAGHVRTLSAVALTRCQTHARFGEGQRA